MAGRGQVSWLPGGWAAPSRGTVGRSSGRHPRGARDLLDPVTVAGPRRFLTGLPLTTDRTGDQSIRPGETAAHTWETAACGIAGTASNGQLEPTNRSLRSPATQLEPGGKNMRQGLGRLTPATIVALLALVAALAGSAYAAGRIDGRTVKVKSLPGNRLKLGSVPANRLKPGAIPTAATAPISEPITGSQIDERSLGQVPSAGYADVAGYAQSAIDAETALNAVNAVNAQTVNGHGAGCLPGTTPFAGACWQTSAERNGRDRARRRGGLRRPGRDAAGGVGAGGVRPAAGRRAQRRGVVE